MIEIKFGDSFVEVTGHAEYAEHGKDIVCSAVSATTALLAYQIGSWYDKKSGFFHIDYDDEPGVSRSLFAYQRFMIELEQQYPENIKVVIE